MQAQDATQTPASMPPTPRRLLVLVGGPFPGPQDDRAGLILARARRAEVLVVAPTLPIPGERWTIDLDARKAQARANLLSWTDALVDKAESVHGEIGDESPRLAVADALDGFAADEYLDARVPEPSSPRQRRPRRLRDVFGPAPLPAGPRAGHA
jgi:hypothetical protein